MAKAPTTHVWLLEQGSPDRPERAGGWLVRRLQDPGVLPVSWPWLRAVVAWVLTRLRRSRVEAAVAALPGPAPETAAVSTLAASLQRNLGKRYACSPVLHLGHPDAAAAAAAVPRGAQVVLLPLQLVADAARRQQLARARKVLASRRVRVAEVHGLQEDPYVLKPVVRGIRRAVLELPRHTGYVVLFCSTAHGEAARERAEALRIRIAGLLRLNRADHLLWLPAFGVGKPVPDVARRTLDRLRGEAAVVVVPLGPLTAHADVAGPVLGELVPGLEERGVQRVVVARPAAKCTSLVHALVARVRAAEASMNWAVPEDGLLAEVTAEIERQGSVALPVVPRGEP